MSWILLLTFVSYINYRIIAAEMWQQGKDHVAKEMRQLKRLKMQQVLKEMELEAEYKIAHEQYR